MASGWKSVLSRVASTVASTVVREATRAASSERRRPGARGGTRTRRAPEPAPERTPSAAPDDWLDGAAQRTPLPPAGAPRPRGGAGDFTGRGELTYAPRDDGRPDPGEVVWAWVPFEEGDGRGKDRPVLVAGRTDGDLIGFMLTSKDHDRDSADEARHGRHWVDIGTGAWDRQGRPSEVRVDRVLRVAPADVRREGAVLDRRRFEQVAAEARRVLGW